MEDLDTVEPLPARLQRHSFDRLIMLSDGVFAIAVTLAALELRPRGDWTTSAQLWRELKLPLVAYAVSFSVIAAYWSGHRDTFARLRKVDTPLTLLTLLLLFFTALLPAATQLLYEKGNAIGVEAYAAAVCACGFSQSAIWAYAAFRPEMMTAEVPMPYRFARLATALVIPAFFTWLLVSGVRSIGPEALYASIVAVAVLAALRRFALPRLHRLPA